MAQYRRYNASITGFSAVIISGGFIVSSDPCIREGDWQGHHHSDRQQITGLAHIRLIPDLPLRLHVVKAVL